MMYNYLVAKNTVQNFLYEKESYKIRGACFRVYNVLGGGIKEKIIEKALLKELLNEQLTVDVQPRIDIIYNSERIGVYIPDLIIDKKIIIELKSKPFVSVADEKQFWGYLKGSEYKLGLLINFGPQRLDIKRFAHSNKFA
ncbi:MAG: GxxExxY protein [Candidatus Wolfebacteria bacterium]|nr:GxxExxY protein [Candidatus Wolfebacteria bacterium]